MAQLPYIRWSSLLYALQAKTAEKKNKAQDRITLHIGAVPDSSMPKSTKTL